MRVATTAENRPAWAGRETAVPSAPNPAGLPVVRHGKRDACEGVPVYLRAGLKVRYSGSYIEVDELGGPDSEDVEYCECASEGNGRQGMEHSWSRRSGFMPMSSTIC